MFIYLICLQLCGPQNSPLLLLLLLRLPVILVFLNLLMENSWGDKNTKTQFVSQRFPEMFLLFTTFGNVTHRCVPVGRTLMRPGLPLLHLLDEDVEHLGLHELLDEVPGGVALDGLVEGPALERPARLRPATRGQIRGIVAHRLHKEAQEGLGHHAVPLLHG